MLELEIKTSTVYFLSETATRSVLSENVFLVADLVPATLLKKRLWRRCFPVNFAKFLRTPFLTEHLRSLLLKKYI